jgi:hypothetical protein
MFLRLFPLKNYIKYDYIMNSVYIIPGTPVRRGATGDFDAVHPVPFPNIVLSLLLLLE